MELRNKGQSFSHKKFVLNWFNTDYIDPMISRERESVCYVTFTSDRTFLVSFVPFLSVVLTKQCVSLKILIL